MTWTTERAVEMARAYHDATGCTDPGSGEPYFTHPLRVMQAVAAAGFDYRYQRVAILHDTIEDADLTVELLQAAGAPPEEVAAVLSVTKPDPDIPYPQRVAKAAADIIGGVVKGFDMLDNSDPARMAALAQVEPARAERLTAKYAAGLQMLDQLRPGWGCTPGPAE